MKMNKTNQPFLEEGDNTLGSDGVIVVNPNLKIISFSDEAERILNFQMSEVTNQTLYEIFGENIRQLDSAFFDTINHGNIHSNLVITLFENRQFSFSLSPLHSVKKQIVGLVINFRDLDEMTRLMQEVSEKNYEILVERNKLASILNSITDGVFTIDLNWQITSINQAAQKITGYSEKEAIGKECGLLLRGNRCDQYCPMRKTIEEGKPTKNMEVEIRHKEGNRIPISVSTSLLYDYQNKIIGAVETFQDRSDILKLSEALENRFRFDRILGKSKPMQEMYELLENVIETDSTVLIQGESGTGKELVARAIHYNSQRKKKSFIAVNCSALSENLLESELFGHEKGSFTGAVQRKLGRFELANSGTLFLDEVADMSSALQVKILRILDEQVFERVGGTQSINVNVRIITATNKDLFEEVKKDRFREDLYYRLNVVPIWLPPLRERKEDILLLIKHFIDHFNHKMGKNITDLSPSALDYLTDYDWPGNVRELENAIEHSFVRCRDREILVEHLPKQIIKSDQTTQIKNIQSLQAPLQKTEREVLLKVLEEVNQNRQKTAQRLGVSKATLWRKMKKHQII